MSIFLFSRLCPFVAVFSVWLCFAAKPTEFSVSEHYSRGAQAMEEGKWSVAKAAFSTIVQSHLQSPYGASALFHLGESYYELGDLSKANRTFADYLHNQGHLKHYDKAVRYRLAIAEAFRGGERQHLLGIRILPKWSRARSYALEIYEDLLRSCPTHEVAAYALVGKADILFQKKEYRQAIEALHQVTERFPKHLLASTAYVKVAKVYHHQSHYEHANPDLLGLALVNLERFKQARPRDPKLLDAEKLFEEMQENYAGGLYEVGRFYERKGKPMASVLYYRKALAEYPNTQVAAKCLGRLKVIKEVKDSDT